MFRHKKHLFFDLDHTLWDYHTCSNETLEELWQRYKLQQLGIPLAVFMDTFYQINDELWERFHDGLIDKNIIRKERFPAVFAALHIHDPAMAASMQTEYIHTCPTKPHLVPGARQLLDHLAGRYRLHIITNGFEEVQDIKLKSGGIAHYFEVIVTSAGAGAQKPQKEIFDFALQQAGAQRHESLMIGDNPVSDIAGAHRAGIDQVFYNPRALSCPVKPTLEIQHLNELLPLF